MRSEVDFSGVARLYLNGTLEGELVADSIGFSTQCPSSTTRFQLASVSKQFTAALTLLLISDGALRLEDRLGRWWPHCPPGWQEITIEQLLRHCSRVAHWRDYATLNLTRTMPATELDELFFGQPLRPPNAEPWYYSSPGYVFLARIAELLTGESYSTLLATRIFEPLQMNDTFAGNAAGRPACARGFCDGREVESFELDVIGKGAGDVWSCADDMWKWDNSLFTGSLLAPTQIRAMTSLHAPLSSEQVAFNNLPSTARMHTSGYGWGWFVGTFDDQPMYFHPGDNFGFVALNLIVPAKALALFVLSNDESPDRLWSAADYLLDVGSR